MNPLRAPATENVVDAEVVSFTSEVVVFTSGAVSSLWVVSFAIRTLSGRFY
jgi:hypothetical protein